MNCHCLEVVCMNCHCLEVVCMNCHCLEVVCMNCHCLEVVCMNCHCLEVCMNCHCLEVVCMNCHCLEVVCMNCHCLEVVCMNCHCLEVVCMNCHCLEVVCMNSGYTLFPSETPVFLPFFLQPAIIKKLARGTQTSEATLQLVCQEVTSLYLYQLMPSIWFPKLEIFFSVQRARLLRASVPFCHFSINWAQNKAMNAVATCIRCTCMNYFSNRYCLFSCSVWAE